MVLRTLRILWIFGYWNILWNYLEMNYIFKYINLWAFDVGLSLCHDIGDYPVCVTTLSCGPGWGFWFWNDIGYTYDSHWLICSFIVILGSLVLQYVYHSCHDVKEIYFVEFKWKFPNYSMFVKWLSLTCISPTPINYATYWALSYLIILETFQSRQQSFWDSFMEASSS